MTAEPSYLESKSRIRVSDLQEAKRRQQKWAMLTSYDAVSAQIFDRARIPCLLVGDSAGQMVFGYNSTLPVTMDELIPLARAVSTGCKRALVAADLPFGSYQASVESAVQSSIRFMKEAQVHAVKLEGGREFAPHVRAIVNAGVPVIAHIGFRPQNVHSHGGFKIQARDPQSINDLIDDALALQGAGAFACVLELVSSDAGRCVTERLDIPTIGIGAGPDCDAQILVWHDMAGFSAPQNNYLGSEGHGQLQIAKAPKFVKRFANLSEELYKAARDYASEVEAGSFPAPENSYSMLDDQKDTNGGSDQKETNGKSNSAPVF